MARLLKYSYDGRMTTAARVFFVRKLKGDGGAICYLITVETEVKYEQELLPTLDKLIKSIKLTTVQSPASLKTSLSEMKLKDYRGGFSVRVPSGWYGRLVKGGVAIGQKNYLIGGAISPQIAILATEVGSDDTSESYAKKAVSQYLAMTSKPDGGAKLISHGPAKVGDHDAYQYIFKLAHEAKPSAKPADSKATSKPARVDMIKAVRVVCRTDRVGLSIRAYLFALACVEDESKLVGPWLDAVSGGFEYLPVAGKGARPRRSGAKSTTPNR